MTADDFRAQVYVSERTIAQRNAETIRYVAEHTQWAMTRTIAEDALARPYMRPLAAAIILQNAESWPIAVTARLIQIKNRTDTE